MISGRFGATFRQIETLMRVGSTANASDGQLLDRFLDRRDGGEEAFEALVARHGGMVMGVCRQVLGSDEGSEDAFQATFLVLVRQAGSIKKRESLGPWLHGVARRVSLRARRDAARRRERERHGFKVVGGCAPDEGLAATLHDEIARLPEKYRTPIVLCDLEGQSHAEAARHLDWPIGTVSGRLSRARALLRTRIARRGVALSIASLVVGLNNSAKAAVPRKVVATTIKSTAAGVEASLLTPTVGALVRSTIRPRSLVLMRVAAGLLATAAVGFGSVVTQTREEVAPAASAVKTVAPADEPTLAPISTLPRQIEDEVAISAFALAPDGQTLASGSWDARVTLWDLTTGLEKATFVGHTDVVTSVSFTRDGHLLASTSRDHTIRVWDVESGQEAMSVTMLDAQDAQQMDLGAESLDSSRSAPGRDRCADGSVREADFTSGA